MIVRNHKDCLGRTEEGHRSAGAGREAAIHL